MYYDAIFNNDIILPAEMEKIINKTTSAYLENTTTPMRLDNRKKDFTIPNTLDMTDM